MASALYLLQVFRAVKLEKEAIDLAVEAVRVVHSSPQTIQSAQPALSLVLGLMHYIEHQAPQALAAALHLLPSIHSQPQVNDSTPIGRATPVAPALRPLSSIDGHPRWSPPPLLPSRLHY